VLVTGDNARKMNWKDISGAWSAGYHVDAYFRCLSIVVRRLVWGTSNSRHFRCVSRAWPIANQQRRIGLHRCIVVVDIRYRIYKKTDVAAEMRTGSFADRVDTSV